MVEFDGSHVQSDEAQSSEADAQPFRFGISHLLYGTALVASGLVVAGPWSVLFSGIVLAGWFLAFRSVEGNCFIWILALIALILLIGSLLPAVAQVRTASRRIACQNNMRQCMLALHNYHSANLHMPGAYSVDAQGKPMHSWRVRLLPFVEQTALYDLYDFNEPWDGPNNSKLANQMPYIYRCPSVPHSNSETTYKLVSDPEAFFDGDKRRSFKEAVDDVASIVVLVEDSEDPINWMKPEDISIEAAVKRILSLKACHCGRSESLLKDTYFGPNICTIDAAAHRISPNADPMSFRQALRFADGHSPDVLDFAGSHVVHKPQGYIALAVYLFLLVLPGWFLKKSKRAGLSR